MYCIVLFCIISYSKSLYLQHSIDKVPKTDKKLDPQIKCRVCWKKFHKRVDTRYYCVQCNIGLCIVGCFGVSCIEADTSLFLSVCCVCAVCPQTCTIHREIIDSAVLVNKFLCSDHFIID